MLFQGAVRNAVVRYYIDHDNDHRKATFVSGMGRSGTTWLAELINYRNDYRLVFEPFNPERVALAVNFKNHQYLRPGNRDPHFLSPAKAILEGYVRGWAVDRFNRRLVSGRRIVKDVSANLFLRWLYEQFPGMPVVLIIRHPFAVTISQIEAGLDCDLDEEYLSQPDLVSDYLSAFLETMRGCRTKFERLLAMWCIEVGLPLSQFRSGELCVVFYEHVSTRPLETLSEVFSHLSRPFDRRIVKDLSKPSPTAQMKSRLEDDWRAGAHQVAASWTDRITSEQRERGLELLRAFGMNYLYGAEPMPLVDRVTLPGGLWRQADAGSLRVGETVGRQS